jgi:hypothetical protein
MGVAWGAWAAATSNPPTRASDDDSDGLRGRPASGGRAVSIAIEMWGSTSKVAGPTRTSTSR